MAKRSEQHQSKIGVRILQFFIIAVCSVFIVLTIARGTFYIIKESRIFRVREVVSQESLRFIRSKTLDRLIGENIFDIDLVAVQRRLQSEYPQIDKLRIYRQFPNRIYVDALRRDPLAIVETKRQRFVIDREGAALSLTPPANSNLPVISGLSLDQPAQSGQAVNHPEIAFAVSVIQAVTNNPHLQSMPVVSLDMSNLSQIQCILSNGIRVILAEEHIEQKISMLGIMMKQGGIKPENVNYIDLRFKEPILSNKTQPGQNSKP